LPPARRRRGCRSVRPATKDARGVRWYVHVPPLFRCTLANGSARTQVGAMEIIVASLPQPCKQSPSTWRNLLSHQRWLWSVSMDNMATQQ
jgi:hypothetical protein